MKTKNLITALVMGGVCQLAAVAGRAQDFDSFAPVVVKTVPEAGSTNVPPGEIEVKVTFSKPMMDSSWSWSTAWENSTPTGIGGPRYDADHRTCILKVKLEAGKCYGYWLNSDRFHHFQDPQHRPAVPYLLVFSTTGWQPGSAANSGGTAVAGDPTAVETIQSKLEHALSESSPGKREAAFNGIQRTISTDDIPAALAYLAKKGQTSTHSLFADLACKWGSQDVRAAIIWATNVPDADIQRVAVAGVVKGWTQTAPEPAAAFAATLPAGDLHDDAVMTVANEWSFRDAGGTAAWVSHLPKGPLQIKAAGPVIFWGQGQAPAAVAEMLDTIGETNLIQNNGEAVASLWLRRDDAAARAWIKKSPLSEEVKQRLLNQTE